MSSEKWIRITAEHEIPYDDRVDWLWVGGYQGEVWQETLAVWDSNDWLALGAGLGAALLKVTHPVTHYAVCKAPPPPPRLPTVQEAGDAMAFEARTLTMLISARVPVPREHLGIQGSKLQVCIDEWDRAIKHEKREKGM